MNNLQIYKKAAELLKKGENIALSTVISTTGSTPGKVGYKMLIWGKKPETFATVGGGFCEAQIISKAEKILPKIKNQVLKFNLDGTEYDEKGICGGTIEFLIETFDLKSLPLFEEISNCIMNGKNGILLSIISPESSPEKIFFKNVEEIYSHTGIGLPPEICQSIKKIYDKGQPGKIRLNNNLKIFIETFSQQPMVYIFGAGHLSYYIAKFAQDLNCRVTVCDDRAEFANKERFPHADNIVVEDFDKVFDKLNIDENSYIIIVTKGHKYDQIVLEKAVKTNPIYIGMIGSKRKTLTILKRLSNKGFSGEILSKVYSPIGISIGAVTPEEIALSIICELVKIKRLGDASEINHMTINFSK